MKTEARIINMKNAIFESKGPGALDEVLDIQRVLSLIENSNKRKLTADETNELETAYKLLLPIFQSIAS